MSISDRLDEITARCDAATEGPWIAEYSGEQGNCVIPHDAESTRESVAVTRLYYQAADAEFIAHARTDVPWLIEQVRKREAALRAVLDRHKPVVECCNPRHTNFDIGCPECLEVCAHGCEGPWPCPTFLAVAPALGEA